MKIYIWKRRRPNSEVWKSCPASKVPQHVRNEYAADHGHAIRYVSCLKWLYRREEST